MIIRILYKIRPVILCIMVVLISISSEALALRPKAAGRNSDTENAIVRSMQKSTFKIPVFTEALSLSDRVAKDGRPSEDSEDIIALEQYEAISEILSRLTNVTEIIPTTKHLVVVQSGEVSLRAMLGNLPSSYLTVYDLTTRQPVSESLNRRPIGTSNKLYINDGYICIRLWGNTIVERPVPQILQSPCTFFDLSNGEILEDMKNLETPFMRDDAVMMSKTHAAVLNLNLQLTVFDLAKQRPVPGLINLDASRGYALYDNYLAAYGEDNNVRIYNPATGRPIATLYAFCGFAANKEAVAVSRLSSVNISKEEIVIWKPDSKDLLISESPFGEYMEPPHLEGNFVIMSVEQHTSFQELEGLMQVQEIERDIPTYVLANIITGKLLYMRCYKCEATKDHLIKENPSEQISVCNPESGEPVNGLIGLDAESGHEKTDSHLITIDSQEQLRAFHLYTGKEILSLPGFGYSFSKVFLQGPGHISYLWIFLPNRRVISYLLDGDRAVPFHANRPWRPSAEFTSGKEVLSISGEEMPDGTGRAIGERPNSPLLIGKVKNVSSLPITLKLLYLKAKKLLLKSRQTAREIDAAA